MLILRSILNKPKPNMPVLRYGVLLLLFISSCTFSDNDSFEPAYLILSDPQITVRTDEGAPVNGIQDAWVFADGQLIGVFPLPAKVPLITTGKAMQIQINAGVKENADRNISAEYPFFTPLVTTLTPEPGKAYTIPLDYQYKDETYFDFTEGFETSLHLLTNDLDGNTETRLSISNEDAVFGNKSGLVKLTRDNDDAEFTLESFLSNNNNKRGAVYLEFDYKSEEVIYVGTQINTQGAEILQYKVLLLPTDTWKRAYINFSDEISAPNVVSYRPVFRVIFEDDQKEFTKTYFDNIKLVHF
jgi:hypothetical protein